MGNSKSKAPTVPIKIKDSYETMDQFSKALKTAGLEKCNLLVAIDFTKSNTWQGEKTFGGKCLHTIQEQPEQQIQNISPGGAPPPYQRAGSFARTLSFEKKEIQKSKDLLAQMNPYQYVLSVAGKQLENFDEDGKIPTCIFGHARESNESYVKMIYPSKYQNYCFKIDQVIEAYENAVTTNKLSGGTCFTPILNWAYNIVSNTKEYHILLIIGDGCIEDLQDTKKALKNLGNVPLSVIFVGVGDGSDPDNEDKWKSMRDLDDNPLGKIDNWQSVYLANIKNELDRSSHPDVDLAINMFMEIPEQYKYFKKSGLIKN